MVLVAFDMNLAVVDKNLIRSDGFLSSSSQWGTSISERNLPSASSPDDEHIRFFCDEKLLIVMRELTLNAQCCSLPSIREDEKAQCYRIFSSKEAHSSPASAF